MWNFVWVGGFDRGDRDEDKRVLCQGRWIRVRKGSVGIGNSVSCKLCFAYRKDIRLCMCSAKANACYV